MRRKSLHCCLILSHLQSSLLTLNRSWNLGLAPAWEGSAPGPAGGQEAGRSPPSPGLSLLGEQLLAQRPADKSMGEKADNAAGAIVIGTLIASTSSVEVNDDDPQSNEELARLWVPWASGSCL